MSVELQLAELAIEVGANMQPGQLLRVTGEVGQVAFARLVAEAAYRRGARYVEVDLFDPIVQRARIEHAPVESLEEIPQWRRDLVARLGSEHAASVKLAGITEPHAFDGLDARRAARASLPNVPEWHAVELAVNWTVIPAPTRAWAEWLRPRIPVEDAYAELLSDLSYVCRLDATDPGDAWRRRLAELQDRATQLNALELDAVRFSGPATELTVGLLPTARWDQPLMTASSGITHMPNLPTEEVFTVPDPERVDGHVRLTRPAFVGGRSLDDITLVFQAGRVVTIEGGSGAEALRAWVGAHPGADRLGEVALVDGDSRVARARVPFGIPLLDENACCHIALGYGFPELLPIAHAGRVNASDVHLDVMIGADNVTVTGIDGQGHNKPLLHDERWVAT